MVCTCAGRGYTSHSLPPTGPHGPPRQPQGPIGAGGITTCCTRCQRLKPVTFIVTKRYGVMPIRPSFSPVIGPTTVTNWPLKSTGSRKPFTVASKRPRDGSPVSAVHRCRAAPPQSQHRAPLLIGDVDHGAAEAGFRAGKQVRCILYRGKLSHRRGAGAFDRIRYGDAPGQNQRAAGDASSDSFYLQCGLTWSQSPEMPVTLTAFHRSSCRLSSPGLNNSTIRRAYSRPGSFSVSLHCADRWARRFPPPPPTPVAACSASGSMSCACGNSIWPSRTLRA